MRREIHERNYTWRENFYKAFDGFIELVISKLPNVSYLFFSISTIEFVYNLLSGKKEKPKLPQVFRMKFLKTFVIKSR